MGNPPDHVEEMLRELRRRARVAGDAGPASGAEDSLATEDDVERVEALIETNDWPHLRG